MFPGISDKYGADLPVDLHYTVNKMWKSAISEADQTMTVFSDVTVDLWVLKADGEKELALSADADETNLSFSALVDEMKLALQVTKVNSSEVKINSCTFGEPSARKLKLELNNLFRIAQIPLNRELAENLIPLPDEIGGLFTLSDLTLGYYDNYLYAGATPVFIGPPSYTEAALQ
jgi:hypothetical protein